MPTPNEFGFNLFDDIKDCLHLFEREHGLDPDRKLKSKEDVVAEIILRRAIREGYLQGFCEDKEKVPVMFSYGLLHDAYLFAEIAGRMRLSDVSRNLSRPKFSYS